MTREKRVGNYCKKCELVLKIGRSSCHCMATMIEMETKRHRLAHWLPCYVRVSVSMESANRG